MIKIISLSNYRSLIGIIAFSALVLGGCNNTSEESTKQTATETATTSVIKEIEQTSAAKGYE